MSMIHQFGSAFGRWHFSPLWFRFGSAVLLSSSLALLVVSLNLRVYDSSYARAIVPALITGMGLSVLVFGLYFRLIWKKQRASNRASDAALRTFASVFEHVLDGVLILDDGGVCLEANPAACGILRVTRDSLLRQPFSRFFENAEAFASNWKSILANGSERGYAELRQSDGQKLYVDYAVAANYMPGQHILVLCNTTERLSAQSSLRESEERFREIADNIQEIFWMMDAQTKEVLFVTPAYDMVTGHSRAALLNDPLSYRNIIHPEDRPHVLRRLDEASVTGVFDEEFRIVRADGKLRWLWSKTSPRPESQSSTRWFVGFALDITARKHAESEAKLNFVAAQAAHAETEALRKATLALTQNLSMDAVLDALLSSLRDLVPYDFASVLIAEDESRLYVGRDFPKKSSPSSVARLTVSDTPVLRPVFFERKSVFLQDTAEESGWKEIPPLTGARSWIAVPLLTSNGMFGILSIAASTANKFLPEHFRFAKSLAIPAAAAIYNARLYEVSVICSTELESQVAQLKETQKALEASQSGSSGKNK
jgi:PAS domain S-box-containing protein